MEDRGHIIYGKEDIKKNCKYCKKSKENTIETKFGYKCILRLEKRNCNRCKTCLFGRHIGIY